MLEQGIINLINGTPKPKDAADLEVVQQIYAHSLVNGYSQGKSKPSYLASRSFRNALFDVTDLLAATSEPSDDPLHAEAVKARVEETLSNIPNEKLKTTLTAIWNSCHHDATEFRAGVERWFDRGMERVTGWYKRRTQTILFVLGVGVAIALNASALLRGRSVLAQRRRPRSPHRPGRRPGRHDRGHGRAPPAADVPVPGRLARGEPARRRRCVGGRPRRLAADRLRRHVRRAVLVRRPRPVRQPPAPAGKKPADVLAPNPP